jgi:hypothetical protein
MTDQELASAEKYVKFVQIVLHDQVNCFNCEHCDIQGNICRLFGSQPPLKIIVKGCPSFSRTIPF